MVDIDFQFRPVGQGAFYTGVFRLPNGKTFSLVYDCGTESSSRYIDREILDFAGSLDDKLDILFVSHFHADHINKIPDLLNQVAGIKKVIIPYLSPEEIILAITDGFQSAIGLDPDTTQLIENPVEFFGDKAEQIIFIHPGDDGETFSENLPTDPKPSDEVEGFHFNMVLKEKSVQSSSNPRVKHCYSNSYGVLNGIWKFQMYNKSRDTQVIQAFLRSLENLIGSKPTYQSIAAFQQQHPIDFGDLLRDIYGNHFGSGQHINNTSLIVYHYGMSKSIFKRGYHQKWLYSELNGTFLTGDIVLDNPTISDIDNSWNNINWKYNDLIFQIPHHGSRNNTLFNLVEFPLIRWWIINVGLGNKHSHPHQDTIDHIVKTKLSGTIFCNTQLQGFRYGGILV